MNTAKLKEALEELKAERATLNSAIATIERLIGGSNGSADVFPILRSEKALQPRSVSYVDLSVEALRNHGKPMKVKDLTYEVGKLKGQDIERRSLEATLFRHIRLNKAGAKLVKVGRGFYALPSWPHELRTP